MKEVNFTKKKNPEGKTHNLKKNIKSMLRYEEVKSFFFSDHQKNREIQFHKNFPG